MINIFFTPTSVAIIILGAIFLFITKSSLNRLIEKGVLVITNRWFRFNSTKQEPQKKRGNEKEEIKQTRILYKSLNIKGASELKLLIDEKNKNLYESKTRENTLFQLWKNYMFSYFNLFFVLNTKVALLWFYNNPSSSKEMFNLTYNLPPQITNQVLEKEIIFNVLLRNGLIEKDAKWLYSTSNMGHDFLTFIGFIK
jgi:hypothetical protein